MKHRRITPEMIIVLRKTLDEAALGLDVLAEKWGKKEARHIIKSAKKARALLEEAAEEDIIIAEEALRVSVLKNSRDPVERMEALKGFALNVL